MIGSLRGTLLDRSLDGDVLIEVAGVGYRVTVAPTAVARGGRDRRRRLPAGSTTTSGRTPQTLYGFATREERVCFEALLGAHGVGPALALAILSVHGPGALREVIADRGRQRPLPGARGGQRRPRPACWSSCSPASTCPTSTSRPSPGAVATSSARRDVTEALAGLGYGPDEVRRVVDDLPSDGEPADLLREALRRLAVA